MLNSLFFSNVRANPVAIYEESGSPMVKEDTKIQFISEDIIYVINGTCDVVVTANYAFYNPTNEKVNQSILLPFRFLDDGLPDNLIIKKDGLEIPYDYEGGFTIDGWWDEKFVMGAMFVLSFESYETITIEVKYSLALAITPHDGIFLETFSCNYLTKTAIAWNNSIEQADFTFKIKKDLSSFILGGFSTSDEADYVIASKSYTNWVPTGNICLRYGTFNFQSLFVVILLITLSIIGGSVLYFNKRKKYLKDGKAVENLKHFKQGIFSIISGIIGLVMMLVVLFSLDVFFYAMSNLLLMILFLIPWFLGILSVITGRVAKKQEVYYGKIGLVLGSIAITLGLIQLFIILISIVY
jgi:hypothetical protein